MKRLATAMLALSGVLLGTLTDASANPRLFDAIRRGDREAVGRLLQQGVDINTTEPDGSTALIVAADRGDAELVSMLTRAHASVNAANEYGATALSAACARGDARLVSVLLEAGADPNLALVSGETPLMTAIESGALDVVRALLDRRADVNARETNGGQTALMWAAADRHADIVKLLVDRGADVRAVSKTGFTALHFSAQQGDIVSARHLLQAGAPANQSRQRDGMTPLMVAAASGHTAVADALLGVGADVGLADANGFTALHHAVTGADRAELVGILLSRGAMPNARTTKDTRPRTTAGVSLKGATPLFLAAMQGHAESVRALLAGGADALQLTDDGTAPLHVATWGGDPYFRDWTEDEKRRLLDVTKQLVERGADVNSAGEHQWTALHGAAYKGADAVVQFLIERGAKTEVFDEFGQTPLSIANAVITVGSKDYYYQSSRVVRKSTSELLLKLGAKPLAESGVQVFDLFYKSP